MSRIESHRDLLVWQKAMDFTVQIYRIASLFPQNEIYRLTSQITRAAASVPANIAEGNARGTRKDYAQFLAVAKGSLMEAETFLMLAIRLGYVKELQAAPTLSLIIEISKMITALRAKLLNSDGNL